MHDDLLKKYLLELVFVVHVSVIIVVFAVVLIVDIIPTLAKINVVLNIF